MTSDRPRPAGATSRRDLLLSAALLILVLAGSLALFESVWRRNAVEDVAKQPGRWLGAVAVAACGAAVHELLRALAWRLLAGVPWRSISLRATWRGMGFVARVDAPVPAAAYRAGAALPAAVLGGVPAALGLATGSGLLLLWGLFFLLESLGDVAVLLAMRGVPSRARVLDHPEGLGCIDHDARAAAAPGEARCPRDC
jgi:hypothetical protein